MSMTDPFALPLLAFDLETTDSDPLTCQIVSFAFAQQVQRDGNSVMVLQHHHVRPTVPIEPGASAVHGLTLETLVDPLEHDAAVLEISGALWHASMEGWPVVVFHAPFDLTVMKRLMADRGMPWPDDLLVIDPLAMNRYIQPGRVTPRKLQFLCSAFGVELTQAHSSGADAVAALELAHVMHSRYPKLQGLSPERLMKIQTLAHTKFTSRMRRYYRSRGRPLAGFDPEWPIRSTVLEKRRQKEAA